MTEEKSNVGYTVDGMSWNDLKALVVGRLNKLAMCKRGNVETDCNRKLEALGDCPSYTKTEIENIRNNFASTIVKKVRLNKTLVMKHKCDPYGITRDIEKQINKLKKDIYVHPEKKSWEEKVKRIKEQKNTRIALLDVEFKEVEDQFTLGFKKPIDFPAEEMKLEEQEW